MARTSGTFSFELKKQPIGLHVGQTYNIYPIVLYVDGKEWYLTADEAEALSTGLMLAVDCVPSE